MHLRRVHSKLVHAQYVETYEVDLEPRDLISPPFRGSVSSYGGANVIWDERETMVHTAWTTFVAHSVNPGGYITPLSIEARIYMNGALIDTLGWYVTPGCESKSSESGSVSPRNGRNDFKVEMVPTFHPFAAGLDGVTLTLNVQYTGKPPEVTKPPPKWVEEILPYLKWGMIGIGAVGAVLVSVKLYEVAKRSPKHG